MNQIEEKLSEEIIYDGRILKLHVDQIKLPNGKTSIRECVDHKDGAGILVQVDNSLIFVKQYRYAVGKLITEIPAGLVEKGEDPKETAFRELQEEVGLKPLNLQLLGSMYPSPGFTDEQTFIYFASEFEEHRLKADDDEFLEVIKMPIDEVKEKYFSGYFQDAKTVCALGYYFSKDLSDR